MTTIEILREAREWLADENHWCRGIRWREDGANCALGAIERAAFPEINVETWMQEWYPNGLNTMAVLSREIEALGEAANTLKEGKWGCYGVPSFLACVTIFNNSMGWRWTLKMFDLAIEREQARIDREVVGMDVLELQLEPA